MGTAARSQRSESGDDHRNVVGLMAAFVDERSRENGSRGIIAHA